MSAEEPTGPAGSRKNPTEYIRTPEEIEICTLLVELQTYMPPTFVIIPAPQQLVAGVATGVKKWVRPFVGYPERIAWLRDFVATAKKDMIAALPQGVGADVLIEKNMPSSNPKLTKWVDFLNNVLSHNPQVSGVIFRVAGRIRKAFFDKFGSFPK